MEPRALHRCDFPREQPTAIRTRINLRGYPSPALELDRPDSVLAENALGPLRFVVDCNARRSVSMTEDGKRLKSGALDLRRTREQPARTHKPCVWPCGGIQKITEFVAVDFGGSAGVAANGEAMERGVSDQGAISSNEDCRMDFYLVNKLYQLNFSACLRAEITALNFSAVFPGVAAGAPVRAHLRRVFFAFVPGPSSSDLLFFRQMSQSVGFWRATGQRP